MTISLPKSLKERLSDWLLGPAGRAARIVLDAESRLVAIGRPSPSHRHVARVMIAAEGDGEAA